MSFLVYLKVILYTKFENFGIIQSFVLVMLRTNKQNTQMRGKN